MKAEKRDIGAVVFDFGGVISSFDVGIFLRKLAPRTEKTVAEIGSLIYGSKLPVLYESGRISSSEFFARLAALCGLRMSEEEFVRAFTEIFTPIESTLELIRRLKGRYRLGLLSNTNEWHFRGHIETIPVFPVFDTVTLSAKDPKALDPNLLDIVVAAAGAGRRGARAHPRERWRRES